MSVLCMVAAKIWRALRARAAWSCLLTVLVAAAAEPATAQNQSRNSSQSPSPEAVSAPSPAAVVLAAGGIERAAALAQPRSAPPSPSTPAAGSGFASAQGQAAGQSSKDAAAAPENAIAGECAELLKMATDLKAAVDKTTKDTLSVPVVRKAGEIEALARKLRSQDKTRHETANQ